MSWSSESNNIGILREQVIKNFVMKEDGMFTASDDDLTQRANRLLAEFDASGHKMDLFPSVWACLDAFGQWYTQPKFAFAQATFQMSIQRKIGADTIALGMTVTAPAETREQREQAYWLLESEIEARFNTLYVRKGRPTEEVKPNGASPNQEIDTFATTAISHDYVDGKHRIRLHGGRWEKYGVPVYDETLALMGFKTDSVPLGKQSCVGVANALMKDGKPVKVISFQAAATTN